VLIQLFDNLAAVSLPDFRHDDCRHGQFSACVGLAGDLRFNWLWLFLASFFVSCGLLLEWLSGGSIVAFADICDLGPYTKEFFLYPSPHIALNTVVHCHTAGYVSKKSGRPKNAAS